MKGCACTPQLIYLLLKIYHVSVLHVCTEYEYRPVVCCNNRRCWMLLGALLSPWGLFHSFLVLVDFCTWVFSTTIGRIVTALSILWQPFENYIFWSRYENINIVHYCIPLIINYSCAHFVTLHIDITAIFFIHRISMEGHVVWHKNRCWSAGNVFAVCPCRVISHPGECMCRVTALRLSFVLRHTTSALV